MSKIDRYEELSDNQLISQVKNGNMVAWERLMERHTTKAYQIAYGILGQVDDSEEVTQDAFVRIYRALPKFRGDSEFSTWMYRIVVNQARNKYRWNKRRGSTLTVSLDNEIETENLRNRSLEIADSQKPPDEQIVFNEWQKRISAEVIKLPSVNREALILRNVKNLSYEQIAAILGCKVGTVKSRIARGREELRRRLK